jgi:hypothetical protein
MLPALFAAIPLAASANANENKVETSIVRQAVPQAFVFGQFLTLVHTARDDPNSPDLWIVAKALQIDLDKSGGRERAAAMSEFFNETYLALKKQQLLSSYATICTENRVAMSNDRIFDALDRVDDIRDQLETTKMQFVEASLDEDERVALRAFLEKLESGIAYTRIDSRTLAKSTEGDVRVDIERQCLEIETELSQAGGASYENNR